MTTKKKDFRLAALWRFAVAVTALNILGHTYLGFEQSWAQPVVGLTVGITLEFLLELISGWSDRRPFRFLGGTNNFLSFILPTYVTSLVVPMLIYANEQLWPVALAVALAIGSKYIFRVQVGSITRHFLNPSNTGVAVVLLIFPWVGIAQPYQYTENLTGIWNWLLPIAIVISGSYLNISFTKRMPLISAWLIGFAAQAVVRNLFFDTPLTLALLPMTGMAFVLFTFYMVSDPGTTPFATKPQIAFGASVGAVYGLLLIMHIVFGIFFALLIVCTVRGLWLFAQSLATRQVPQTSPEVAGAVTAGGS